MTDSKRILIIDEDGFSRICTAILHDQGYQTSLADSVDEAVRCISSNGVALIVSSYPFALPLLKSDLIKEIPTIVLSNELNDDLMYIMKRINNAICFVKPVDFERFKYIVSGIINGYMHLKGGNIIA